ncbi:hypothetical protein C4J81_13250 [Deltaproteobacteria bacterium Smac51]|nr:hypothetical protein C4J81_13250 [Deltaproteobacteria bacterium Smac51]
MSLALEGIIMKVIRLILMLAALSFMAGSVEVMAQESKEGDKRHPSYNLIGRDAQSAESPLNPNFVVAEEAKLSESGFWRSPYITARLVGLVVTDVDRDGRNEVLYATTKSVHVSRYEGGRLVQLASYDVGIGERLSSLDVFDANKDGRQEIFACIQGDSIKGGSIILHYDNGSLSRAVESVIPWYLRVVHGPGGRELVGQKPAVSGDEVFTGNVMRMSFDGQNIKSQGRMDVPSGGNAFNFAFGRLGSSNKSMSAMIKWPSEHLFIYEGKDRAWESREEYGGTMTVLEPPVKNSTASGATPKRFFMPSRIIIYDIDGDGQNELIVAKNDRGGVPFMSNLRAFTSGTIQAFKYANLSLTPFFRTRTLPGPAVDYALADFDNNGSLDMVVAVMMEQESGMMQDGRSVIVAYEISPGPAAKKK